METAAHRQADAGLVADALELSKPGLELPPLPEDCRRTGRSGVRQGQRLDEALMRTDAALTAQNARTTRCAGFYDRIRASHMGGR